jgi:predicted RNA-binding Zn-ribbon protein involved in translation (DUF1610 family)
VVEDVMERNKDVLARLGNDYSCPNCGVDLDGGDIYETLEEVYPEKTRDQLIESAGWYGWTTENPRRFKRSISVYDQDLDRTTMFMCPDCEHMWNLTQEAEMDKQIKKVQKDIKSGDKKKGVKDAAKLMKMDKKFDAKLEKCDKVMSKKK